MASELGRLGGRSKRRALVEDAAPVPALDSVLAVRQTLERFVADAYAGRLHPRIATGLAALMNLQFRVVDATEMAAMEQRMEKIEAALDAAIAQGVLHLDDWGKERRSRAR